MTPSADHQASSGYPRRGLLAGVGLIALAGTAAFVLTAHTPAQPLDRPISVVTTWSPSPPLTSSALTTPPQTETGPGSTLAADLEPPPEAMPPTAAELPPLGSAQMADPEAVATRFLVTYASFAATEDPAGVDARLAEYTTPSLADELRRDSSAAAALDDLRARNVAFGGEVVDIDVSERSETRTIVAAVVQHTTAVDGVVDPEFSLVPYTVTLVPSGTRWLVAGFTQ